MNNNNNDGDEQTLIIHKIEIPEDFIAHVIGRKGDKIRALQYQSQCSINIDREFSTNGIKSCTIQGSPDNVKLAEYMINEIIGQQVSLDSYFHDENDPQSIITKTLGIPAEKSGFIVGRNGRMIKNLETSLEVQLIMMRENPNSNNAFKRLKITGNPDKVATACQVINQIINDDEEEDEVENPVPSSAPPARISLPNDNPPARINLQNNNDTGADSSSSNNNSTPLLSTQFECTVCFERFNIDDGRICCSQNSSTTNSPLHSLCITCIRQYAHSAITDAPVAHGGLGLKCVEPSCTKIYLLTSFEFYLCEEDYGPLQRRLQEQCLADAELENLVTCSSCGLKGCIEPEDETFMCQCGREQCRYCEREMNEYHQGRTCQEMEYLESGNYPARQLESQISEAIIRKCHRCGINFVKLEGCNKMQCRCGAKQCYVCREEDIGYHHFCRCGDLRVQHGPCRRCQKSCRIWENAEELDDIKIMELQRLAA